MSCRPLGAAAMFAGIIMLLAGSSAAEWERIFEKRGVLVERRTVAGFTIPELRATTTSPLHPSVIFETLWRHREYPAFIPYLKRLDLLSDTGDERIAYEQVAVPLARDRDYTVRIRKRVDPTAQRYELTFSIANDAGPPPVARYVRVHTIQGGWTVEPLGDGKGSIVRYDILSEPGGAIPAWVAIGAQRQAIVDLVRAVLARAQTMQAPE